MKRFGLRLNQRVVIVKDGTSRPHDTGRALRMGIPDDHEQIAIASDALKGKEVIFEFSWIEESWRCIFQDPLADPQALCYKDSSATYLIEGLD